MSGQQELKALLCVVTDAVKAAGLTLKRRFSNGGAQRDDVQALIAQIHANDVAVENTLRTALLASLRGSCWIEDEEEGGKLASGDWWVVDPVEGNINHVHGSTVWGVTATLVRDGEPVMAVIYEPMQDRIYTAIKNCGAHCNGMRMQVSTKKDLRASLVGTGQARPGESHAVHAAISVSVNAMLNSALMVRMAVPATFEIIEVASGRMDAFWQYTQVRSGLAAGTLLVTEAGGVVTDMHGRPWTFASEHVLLAAQGVHAEVAACLASTLEVVQP